MSIQPRFDGRPYYVCVQNLPPDTQYTHLKDFVRTHLGTSHQPGWAEVNQQDHGTVTGTTSLTTAGEANRVFRAFAQHGFNGWPVTIHIWNTSSSPPSLFQCNCPQIYGTPGHADEQFRSGAFPYLPSAAPIMQTAVHAIYTPATQVYTSPPMMYVPVTTPSVTYNPILQAGLPLPSSHYVYPAQAQVYSSGGNKMPVDATRGTVPTVSRRVHFANLDFGVKEDNLRRVIREHAEPIVIQVSRRSDGSSLGWAIAEFRTEQEAHTIVHHLNNTQLGNRVMKVKLDANRSVVRPEPVIAIGSKLPRQ